MPYIVIDGKKIETAAGKTIIQAAYDNGIEVPHFCWHPELTVSGNCRMCLVEVGTPKPLPGGDFEKDKDGNIIISYMPKLQIACATPISDGMHVRVKSETAVKAQEAVMEFLLINHPLDCPICDEAGQCKLQEYAYRHSKAESRFDEQKNIKRKRVPWSPHILFDAERCITCSRCIRFSEEIGKQNVLTFVLRADHVTIEVAEGQQLDNAYSMNVIDICPVGALTSRDFRFKARVWDMSFNDSICPGCARGCNMKIGVRNNEILRLEPRSNPYVNKHWMCDYGRLTQGDFVNDNRIKEPILRTDGSERTVKWLESYTEAAKQLAKFKPDEIMVIGSAKATNEDNYILARFASEILKTPNLDFIRHIDNSFGDNFLKVSDKTPNSIGALEVGIKPGANGISIDKLAENILNGKIKAVYFMDDELSSMPELEELLPRLSLVIVHAINKNRLSGMAHIVMPASTYAEIDGTFTNVIKRVQHFKPAITTAENLRFMGMTMSRLDRFGYTNDRWMLHENRNCKQSWRIILAIANQLNAEWLYTNSEAIFDEIAKKITSFNNMTYHLIDEHQGITLGKGANPDPIVINYVSHYMKPN